MTDTRLARLRQALDRTGLDCVAAIAGPNLTYLTGVAFHLSERPAVGFFPRQGTPLILAGALEASKVESQMPFPVEGVFYQDSQGAAGLAAAFGEAVHRLGLSGRRLGVESGRMRVFELHLLEAACAGCRIESGDAIFAELRIRKDADEVARMRQAVRIAEQALAASLPVIRPGVSEKEIAAELLVQLLRAGSDAELPFVPIVASGPNSALPHAGVTERALQSGDLLVLDWGAAWQGYASDLTRTFAIGAVDAELAHVYQVVQAANEAGRAAARPGAACRAIDQAARDVIARAGYGEYFTHRVGHGLGLEGHEAPSVHGANDEPLAPGMTFTVEPGIYLPGRGGVRIEDDVLVTEEGGESLSGYARELSVVG